MEYQTGIGESNYIVIHTNPNFFKPEISEVMSTIKECCLYVLKYMERVRYECVGGIEKHFAIMNLHSGKKANVTFNLLIQQLTELQNIYLSLMHEKEKQEFDKLISEIENKVRIINKKEKKNKDVGELKNECYEKYEEIKKNFYFLCNDEMKKEYSVLNKVKNYEQRD